MCASDGLRCILYLEIYANEYYGNFLLSSGLPQAGETLSVNKITYICDFSRGGLDTRLHTLVSKPCSEATNIGYFIYWELFLAAYVNSEFILRKILGEASDSCGFTGSWYSEHFFSQGKAINQFKFLIR